MRKILSILMIAIMMSSVLMCAVGCKKDEFAPPNGMEHAADELASFYLYVPEDWQVDYTKGIGGAYYSESDPSSVSVMTRRVESGVKVSDWWSTNVAEIQSVFQSYQLVEEKNAVVSEVSGTSYTYTASLGEVDYKFMQVAFIKNGTLYLFTYTSTLDNFDLHTEDVAQMLQFLTIK